MEPYREFFLNQEILSAFRGAFDQAFLLWSFLPIGEPSVAIKNTTHATLQLGQCLGIRNPRGPFGGPNPPPLEAIKAAETPSDQPSHIKKIQESVKIKNNTNNGPKRQGSLIPSKLLNKLICIYIYMYIFAALLGDPFQISSQI